MAPKKEKAKKKGKGSAKAQKPPEEPTEEVLDDSSKEFYLVQIRDLEARVAKYQQKCYELEVANGGYQEKFEQLVRDRDEVASFLKQQLQQKQDDIADLKDRVLGLQQQKDAEKEAYESDIQKLRHEFQDTKDQLTRENMNLNAELQSLEEFKVHKEDLLKRLAEMKEELEEKQANFKEQIFQLERKAVIDKDRLKKETIQRVNHVAAEFRKASNKQMAETTKRTIRENVSINAQITKMSDTTVDLLEENESLRKKVKQMSREVEIMTANQEELARKSKASQRLVKLVTDKCAQQQEYIQNLEEKWSAGQLANSVTSRTDEMEPREPDDDVVASQEVGLLKSQLDSVLAEKEREFQEKIRLANVLQENAIAIQGYLQNEKRPNEPAVSLDSLLNHLLAIMSSAVNTGLSDVTAGVRQSREQKARRAGSAKETVILHRGELGGLTGPQAQHGNLYKLGDLGLVPRPGSPSPHPEHVRELSATSRNQLSSLKRVLQRSVQTQTDDSKIRFPAVGKTHKPGPLRTQFISAVKTEGPLRTLDGSSTANLPVAVHS